MALSDFLAAIYAFLSTSPARGTTDWLQQEEQADEFLSTSPARGTTVYCTTPTRVCQFLSTSPARGTTAVSNAIVEFHIFLSTSPARGTTGGNILVRAGEKISIHVPREGDDSVQPTISPSTTNFYPRPPRGGRLFL